MKLSILTLPEYSNEKVEQQHITHQQVSSQQEGNQPMICTAIHGTSFTYVSCIKYRNKIS